MAIDCYKIEWLNLIPLRGGESAWSTALGIYAIIETVKTKKIISYIGKSQNLVEELENINKVFLIRE